MNVARRWAGSMHPSNGRAKPVLAETAWAGEWDGRRAVGKLKEFQLGEGNGRALMKSMCGSDR